MRDILSASCIVATIPEHSQLNRKHLGVGVLKQKVGQALSPNAAYFSQYRTVCIDCGADPPVRSRRPRRLAAVWMMLISLAKSGSRGTRADQGVRPTICAEWSPRSKVSGIGRFRVCPTGADYQWGKDPLE